MDEHKYLLEFERKLRAVCGDGEYFQHAWSSSIQWASDLWALRMLSRLVPARTIVEIGSHKGGSMLWLAWCYRPKVITCIDPWEGMSGPSEELLAAFAENAALATERTGAEVRQIRKRSADAADEIPDASVDMVLVDGYHSEEIVSGDLRLYWPKVRPGGVLAGHDYSDFHPDHRGVVRAVNAWEMEPAVTLLAPSRVFFVRKPQGP